MKRLLAVALVLCAVFVGLLAAQTSKPAAVADDSAVQADRALGAAFEKGNSATVNKLLDAEVTWIDTDGIMLERPDALRANLKPLLPITSDVKTIEHKYAKGKWCGSRTTRATSMPRISGCSVRRAGGCSTPTRSRHVRPIRSATSGLTTQYPASIHARTYRTNRSRPARRQRSPVGRIRRGRTAPGATTCTSVTTSS
jgi:hypothetical protein